MVIIGIVFKNCFLLVTEIFHKMILLIVTFFTISESEEMLVLQICSLNVAVIVELKPLPTDPSIGSTSTISSIVLFCCLPIVFAF